MIRQCGVLALLVLVAPDVAVGQDVAEVVKGYRTNVDAFPFYRCTYTLTRGEGVVDERTYQVKWGKGADTAKCRYATDGENEAYEQHGNADPQPAKIPASKDGQPTTSYQLVEGILKEKVIRGPTSQGRWVEAFKGMNLADRTRRDQETDVQAPLDFGFSHRRKFDPVHKLAQPTYYLSKGVGEKEVCGRRCVGIQFDAPADKLVDVVWFDPTQGMLPICHDSIQVGPLSRTVVTSARKLSKDRWFPERILQYDPGDKPKFLFELVLDEVDADTRPTTDDLSITLPEGTGILDTDDKGAYRLRKAEKLSGYDLPELYEKAKQAQTGQLQDTAIEHKKQGQSVWFWVLGGIGLALVAYGGYRWLRRRRPANPPPAAGSP